MRSPDFIIGALPVAVVRDVLEYTLKYSKPAVVLRQVADGRP